ncbi:MAG: DUF4249 domain-containing protein [Bacteroidota bacterium]
MNIAKIILPIVAIALFASCTKEVSIKVPPYVSKLTVNSINEAGDPIALRVSRSVSIADRKYQPDLTVGGAAVDLYENGTLKQTLVFDQTYQAYVSTVTATVGNQYSIKVSAPTYTSVSAETGVPSPITIQNFTRIKNARTDADGNTQDQVIFNFDDPATAGDYYIIRLMPEFDSNNYYYNFCVNTTDASLETVSSENVDLTTCFDNRGIFMRDELFNGTQKQIKLYVNSSNFNISYNGVDTAHLVLELWHVPDTYFRYEKSRISADNSNGDPFAEPVNTYSNVTNGYGIFSMISRDFLLIQ